MPAGDALGTRVAIRELDLLLPRVEQRLHMTALRLAELELRETPARFRRVVVRDSGLEAFAQWRRLRKLAPQPAQQSHRVRA